MGQYKNDKNYKQLFEMLRILIVRSRIRKIFKTYIIIDIYLSK